MPSSRRRPREFRRAPYSHRLRGLWIDWRGRYIVGATKLGQQPFHSSYDPEGGRLLVTTNVDSMVNVIDTKTRQVVQKLPVTKAHGIVSVGIRAGS